ncbi:rhodanese-like domain-containing protein [Lichenifustis flavocetrariae]|uniref:Rhodanese-like domain-containing protein n=1 Tax=Lichenifustis flavocetrariae TaxID=2949735 RepID=A0AA41Z0C9_9HYPH|nr:rhodanese-like domain-containing protein [Lichenifustis flavocetrariae]MCW6508213.1 rhodanese-like domain-containing protein [Lichenifustis flavocetrariae]
MTMDYAGDLSPEEAMTMLASDKNAILVDVRTRPEWQFVGIPDLSALDKEPVLLEWQSYPSMSLNQNFVASLMSDLNERGLPPDAPVLFLCRSGARSSAAASAIAAHGRSRCYNIAGGFEGSHDASRHRGHTEGWKARGLPWAQN